MSLSSENHCVPGHAGRTAVILEIVILQSVFICKSDDEDDGVTEML